MKKISILIFMFLLVGLTGCLTTKVERVKVDEQIDLSGKWNDTDAMMAAKEMVQSALAGSWRETFMKEKGKTPVVIVGHVENRSYEHIDTQVVTKYLESELLNSGKVTFVVAPDERKGVRDERQDQQQGLTDPETIKKIGKEVGADYMLIGSVNSVKDEIKGQYAVLYQVNLELINLETNVKVWLGQKQIKKKVQLGRNSL